MLKSKNPVNIESLHLDLTSKSMDDLDEKPFPIFSSKRNRWIQPKSTSS